MKYISSFKRVLTIGLVFGLSFCAGQAFAVTSQYEEDKEVVRALALVGKPIIYGSKNSKNPKAVVSVFTDLDCGYCHKLHRDIEKLTDLGVEVRYYAYPRQGMGSPGYNKMVTIWCNPNPGQAMSEGMRGEYLPSKTCQNPVDDHIAVGRRLGIMGTPTLIFADGFMHAGYMSPERLAREAIKHAGLGKVADSQKDPEKQNEAEQQADKQADGQTDKQADKQDGKQEVS